MYAVMSSEPDASALEHSISGPGAATSVEPLTVSQSPTPAEDRHRVPEIRQYGNSRQSRP